MTDEVLDEPRAVGTVVSVKGSGVSAVRTAPYRTNIERGWRLSYEDESVSWGELLAMGDLYVVHEGHVSRRVVKTTA